MEVERVGSDHDVLDVNLPLLRVRLLGQPRKSFPKVLTAGLGVTRLAVIILSIYVNMRSLDGGTMEGGSLGRSS